MEKDREYGINALAARLGVSVWVAYKLYKQLPHRRAGSGRGRPVVKESDVRAFEASRAYTPARAA